MGKSVDTNIRELYSSVLARMDNITPISKIDFVPIPVSSNPPASPQIAPRPLVPKKVRRGVLINMIAGLEGLVIFLGIIAYTLFFAWILYHSVAALSRSSDTPNMLLVMGVVDLLILAPAALYLIAALVIHYFNFINIIERYPKYTLSRAVSVLLAAVVVSVISTYTYLGVVVGWLFRSGPDGIINAAAEAAGHLEKPWTYLAGVTLIVSAFWFIRLLLEFFKAFMGLWNTAVRNEHLGRLGV